MRKNERVFLGVTAVIMVAICAFLALRMFYHSDDDLSGPLLPKPEETQQETPKEVEKPVEKVYVNVYFMYAFTPLFEHGRNNAKYLKMVPNN